MCPPAPLVLILSFCPCEGLVCCAKTGAEIANDGQPLSPVCATLPSRRYSCINYPGFAPRFREAPKVDQSGPQTFPTKLAAQGKIARFNINACHFSCAKQTVLSPQVWASIYPQTVMSGGLLTTQSTHLCLIISLILVAELLYQSKHEAGHGPMVHGEGDPPASERKIEKECNKIRTDWCD